MQVEFTISTTGPGLFEITSDVASWLAQQSVERGIVSLFICHSSASLLIQENADPDVRTDLLEWLTRLAPPANDPSMSYLRHVTEGPDDMPAHIKASVLPTHLSIPIAQSRLLLGTWQGVYVVEHRTHPHTRRVIATVLS